MPFDAHKNFAVSLVATAPSPATSGTSLVVTAGEGTRLPATPFNAVVAPNAIPTPANAEVVRVTNRSTDTLTITRAQESSVARAIQAGDRIFAAITAKTLTDVEVATTPADLSILARQLSDLARTRGWLPSGAIAETFPRNLCLGNFALTSGTLYLGGGLVLPGGRAVSSISVAAFGATTTPTNQWFCLVDRSGNVLAKTSDDTTTAWAANAVKTLTISGGYTPANAIEAYLGVLVVAATPPTLRSVGTATSVAIGGGGGMGGTANTGLTNPASLGATVSAVPAGHTAFYGFIS